MQHTGNNRKNEIIADIIVNKIPLKVSSVKQNRRNENSGQQHQFSFTAD